MRVFTTAALIMAVVILSCPTAVRAADDDTASYYDQAYRMYMDEGQPKAQEIIGLLQKELRGNPENLEAVALLGITHMGIGQYEAAIEQFDRYMKINAGNISPKILLKKAGVLHMLGRHNDARMILSTHRAFFQDSPRLSQEYDELYPAVIDGAREDNLSSASTVMHAREVENLQEYIFFAIDEDNYETVADDPEIKVMTTPRFGQTHGWMDIIAIPISDESGTAYCVNFDWDQALVFSRLDRLAAKDKSIEEVREMVREQWTQVDPSTLPDMPGESIAWLRGETTTVSGQNVTAYRLAPDSPGE